MQRDNITARPVYRQVLGIFLFIDLIINVLSWKLPFFWDNILTSTIAQYFYHNGISGFIIPLAWDAGHPPFFAAYLSTCWILLGKSLWVAHLAMLPFLWLKTWGLWSLAKAMGCSVRQVVTALLLSLLTPALLTQSLLISYDLVMVGAFLLALAGIVSPSNRKIILGTMLLVLLSVRGLQFLFILFVLNVIYQYFIKNKIDIKRFISLFAIPAIAAIAWHGYHYIQTGWAVLSPSPSWAGHREWQGMEAITGQGIALTRALGEQGGIVLWGLFGIAVLWGKKISPLHRYLYFAVAVTLCLSMLPLLFFSAPILLRYGMILQVLLILVIAGTEFPLKKWILPLGAVALLSGHAWIYSGLSNSWETTVAHIPYYSARQEALEYLNRKQAAPEKTGTHFPMFTSLSQTDLATDTTRLVNLQGSSPEAQEHIVLSNLDNDSSPETLREIKSDWQEDTTIRKVWVKMTLYHRK